MTVTDNQRPGPPTPDPGWTDPTNDAAVTAESHRFGARVKQEVTAHLAEDPDRAAQDYRVVLDDPTAAEALQHPALEPLLEQAAD